MTYRFSFMLLAIIMTFGFSAQAQGCLPDGITFNTQAQINNFHANYPGCTSIEGNVTINASGFGGNITNLNGLNGITSIGGNLLIHNSAQITSLNGLSTLSSIGGRLTIQDNMALSSLNGLNNLTSVGDDVTIGGSTWQTNAALTNLAGLNNLTTIGGKLYISDNPVLQNVAGLGNLTTVKAVAIYNNQQINSLSGLANLNNVQQEIVINNNPLLTDLGFLINLNTINGYLHISGNTALSSLSALQNIAAINEGLRIAHCPAIVNLLDLSNLTLLKGGLIIENLDGLNDLHGLENINIINDGANGSSLSIVGNALLSSLSGLNSNISTLTSLAIVDNASLSNLQDLNNLIKIGDNQQGQFTIASNPLLTNLNGLQNLTAVPNLTIAGNAALQSLSGLDNVTAIGGTFSLANNNSLTSLNGLGNVISLGNLSISGSSNIAFNLGGLTNLAAMGDLRVTNSTQLKNLTGLENIEVKGTVYIEQNATLENLNGLQGAKEINHLYVDLNPALTSLTGLENVTTIWDGVRIYSNPVLSDLNGLSGLETVRHDFFVSGNQSLTDCSVYGLCQFINNPPTPDSVYILSNAPGCNTEDEVLANCSSRIVTVEVLRDDNATCTSGVPVPDMPVRLQGVTGSILKPTNTNGFVAFKYFEANDFEVILPQLSDAHWNICEVRKVLTAANGSDSTHVSLYLSPKLQCPELNVKLNLPTNFRGCLVNTAVSVMVQNTGSLLADEAKMAVVMPSVFDIVEVNPSANLQNGDTLYFALGDLSPFEKREIKFIVHSSCDAFVMNHTLCWEAFATMDNPCPQTGIATSEIKAKAECINDNLVRFTLKNIGDAPTQGWHEYKIIKNTTIQANYPFSLAAQQSLVLEYPADGATWRIEATKLEDGTQTAAAIENCGGFTPGLITAFWLDHGPVDYDFDCRQVVQAYDPNQKTAIPGLPNGQSAVISGYEPIYYTIDFQNTGTDTAYRVQLIDVLHENLDINTFQAEGSSHPCTWSLRGNTLEVLYQPIALPYSNVSEPASHGFFRFSIRPKTNLPATSYISNFAKIIFDFNPPIWTNWVYHTIGQLTVDAQEHQQVQTNVILFPNPNNGTFTIELPSPATTELRFRIMDLTGRLMHEQVAQSGQSQQNIQANDLPAGLYVLQILSEGIVLAIEKFVKSE